MQLLDGVLLEVAYVHIMQIHYSLVGLATAEYVTLPILAYGLYLLNVQIIFIRVEIHLLSRQ